MKQLEQRQLFSLYCDDVRNEVDGKTTLVGWYGDEGVKMPETGPMVLPRLSIVSMVQTSCDRPFKQLTIQLKHKDNVLQSIDIPEEALKKMASDLLAIGHKRGLQAKLAMELHNLPIHEEGELCVCAFADGEEIVGNGIVFYRSSIASA